MPFARLKTELLDTRNRRQEILLKHLHRGAAGCLLQLSLNVPGGEKVPNGVVGLYCWGERQLSERLSGIERLFAETDPLGPWGLFAIARPVDEAKLIAVALEESRDFARLLDIDVYDSVGLSYDRRQLGLPGRSCLICSEPASDCMRLQRHNMSRLRERLEELLRPFAT